MSLIVGGLKTVYLEQYFFSTLIFTNMAIVEWYVFSNPWLSTKYEGEALVLMHRQSNSQCNGCNCQFHHLKFK